MRLFAAEVLKLRRRWATYVLELVLLGIMLLVFVLVGLSPRGSTEFNGVSPFTFPSVYGVINQFVFGLGSLLAVAFAGAVGGADFTWGVFRVIVARGESRSRYILTKFAAVALFVALGSVVAMAGGILLTYMLAAMQGIDAGSPLSGSSGGDLVRSLGFGLPVMLERAALGFAVAVILRSQIAGIVTGIVLQIGEGIARAILTALVGAQALQSGFPTQNIQPIGPEWFQYLPFSIGNAVLEEVPGVADAGGGGGFDAILRPVPLGTALVVLVSYLVAALVVSALRVERADITS